MFESLSERLSASLRAMAEGGWMCQQDLQRIGVADSDVCRACGNAKGSFAPYRGMHGKARHPQ